MIEEYFRGIEELLATRGFIHSWSITYDKRSSFVGFVRGEVRFVDRSVLYVREFVHVEHSPQRHTYAYHYQGPDGVLVFRYDNAPHYPELPSAPHHKHVTDLSVVPSVAPDLSSVLEEVGRLVVLGKP